MINPTNRPDRRPALSGLLVSSLLAGAAALGLPACSGAGGLEPSSQDSPTGAANFFFGDSNSGGTASEFRLSQLTYGRLVNIDGLNADGIRQTMARDFVINQSLESDDLNYELSLNGVTGVETLLVRRNVDDPDGRRQFLDLLREAGATLDPIQVQDLSTSGTFSMLPRNSALVLTFDDLLLPSSVSDRTIEVIQGYPPSSPFEARVFTSDHYGGVASDGNFYPSRVIVDMTSSLVEQQVTGSETPLNGVGLPASIEPDQANIQIRIPTVPNPSIGLPRVLTNLTDHELATTNNGPVDFGMNTVPVTRALRSGGQAGVVIDPFNGFLRDVLPPQVIGATPLVVNLAPQQVREDPSDTGSLRFVLPEVTIPSELCGRSELDGSDVISQAGLFAQVLKPENLTPTQAQAYLPDPDGKVFNLPVELVSFPREWDGPSDWEQFGAIQSNLETIFQTGDTPDCYVQVLPRPTGFPNAPTQGVSTSSLLSLKFSEPMDPDSLTAFDSITFTRRLGTELVPLSTSDFVVGELTQAATLRDVTFVPVLDLAHVTGASEQYFFSLADDSDAFPPSDLAGNVISSLPTITLTVDAAEPTQLNGGRVSRFSSTDEEIPEGPEWGGQIQIVADRQVVRARPVIRSQVVLDNEQALPAQMTPFPAGVQTPFSTLGSKMQTLWRYSDCGFGLSDISNMNIDVEGLWWNPAGGTVSPDSFNEFEIRLAHCRFAPDELIDPGSLFPQHHASGLRPIYTVNILQEEIQQVVHPKERGYQIDQGAITQTSNGTTLVPMPLNRDIPDSEKRYFTWRDTRLRRRTGISNGGLESLAYTQALGLPDPENRYYRAGSIQTIGLPLLMEFRNSPDLSASGQNAWNLNLVVNSSSRPYFRAFSTGGVNASGNQIFIDPANETMANGGFSPGSDPPGEETFGRDNSFHLGALDYVSRISLAHSIWFESEITGEGPTFTSRTYSEPTVEPSPDAQPLGTSVDFTFRGATSLVYAEEAPGGVRDNYSGPGTDITGAIPDYQYDAFTLDMYGDYFNDRDVIEAGGSPNHAINQNRDNYNLSFLPGFDDPEEWRGSVSDIANARYYQVRMTFTGNPISGQAAEVSAFALTWQQ
jgi:hypothetical protein